MALIVRWTSFFIGEWGCHHCTLNARPTCHDLCPLGELKEWGFGSWDFTPCSLLTSWSDWVLPHLSSPSSNSVGMLSGELFSIIDREFCVWEASLALFSFCVRFLEFGWHGFVGKYISFFFFLIYSVWWILTFPFVFLILSFFFFILWFDFVW
jgi:hypothetical protein